MKKSILLAISLSFGIQGCSSSPPKVAVDYLRISDMAMFAKHKAMCTDIAMTYDLSVETASDSVVGAAVGGIAIAGIATAIAGAVFWPAVPFIAAGTAAGAYLGGSGSDNAEKETRERILRECLVEKGYKVY